LPKSAEQVGACLAAILITGFALAAEEPAGASPLEQVGQVMDDWHAAAGDADGERYFGHFAPEGVFLGTDDGERWTVDEFRAYAEPHFSKGRGWTYVPSRRHVMLSADGRLAWLDEKLDNEGYGRLRGTGVLRHTPGGWKLVHYSMSFPVPNPVTRDVVALIRGRDDVQGSDEASSSTQSSISSGVK
jgi:ketosteroid isomerase-like protein